MRYQRHDRVPAPALSAGEGPARARSIRTFAVARVRRAVWCALLLAGCASPPRALPPTALHNDRPTTIALRPTGAYSLVRTRINGRDAGHFLLATASNVTILERGTAQRLALPVVGSGRVEGIAGHDTLDYRRFDSLSLDGFELRPTRLASLNFAALHHGNAPRWAGILGFDALGTQLFTLDQQARTLRFDNQFPHRDHIERLMLHNGLPVVAVRLGEHHALLILDTGADKELSLHRDVVQRWPDILSVPDSGPGRSRGVGGTVEGSLTWVSRLSMLGVTMRDVPVSVDPRPAGLQDPQIAGRVGNRLLRHYRLTFDAPRRRIAARWLPQ